jgi:hypothetical protein
MLGRLFTGAEPLGRLRRTGLASGFAGVGVLAAPELDGDVFSIFLLIREVGAERAVVITYVAPAVPVAAGVTMLSEPLDARIAVSFVLIRCGSYMATGRSTPAPQIAEPAAHRI